MGVWVGGCGWVCVCVIVCVSVCSQASRSRATLSCGSSYFFLLLFFSYVINRI